MSSKTIRIFLKPYGAKWVDIPLPDDVGLAGIINIMKYEGCLWSDHVYVPASEIHFIAVVGNAEVPRPNLVVFPGGDKPEAG